MKILVGCLNVNGLGGSELYHYELVKELHNEGIDVTLFTGRPADPNDQVRIKLNELGIKQLDSTHHILDEFDLIIASQPSVNEYLLKLFPNIPIISIIHSEIRSEDPILDSRISHYIGIRQPIVDMLINEYKIDSNKVSLIYNPVDTSRFNLNNRVPYEKTTGIFVGEVLDNIRYQAVSHLVNECIQQDWDLLLMSDSRYDFKHPNIKYVDKCWNTESIVKNVDFTAGILLGRTTLEGLCCGVPGYVYYIDKNGNVTGIDLIESDNIQQFDSKYVAQQHIELYNKIINK
jgi:glycosyltransferase involved in cell wall biosynthesis